MVLLLVSSLWSGRRYTCESYVCGLYRATLPRRTQGNNHQMGHPQVGPGARAPLGSPVVSGFLTEKLGAGGSSLLGNCHEVKSDLQEVFNETDRAKGDRKPPETFSLVLQTVS